MTDDREKNNQLVKAKRASLQKRASNIISRGLSDLALLDVEDAAIVDEEEILSQAREWFEKGYKYDINKDYDNAIEAYTKAIALDPHYSDYNNRGVAYYNKGQYDRVIEDYNKAISINPNDAFAHYIRGLAYYYKGQYGRTIEDYNRAIQLDQNYAQVYYERGLVYEKLGNKSMAISDYRKACDLGLEIGCENLQRVLKQK